VTIKKLSDQESNNDTCTFVVDGEITIYVIDEMKNTLSEALGKHVSFVLDLSAVEEVDSSCIQLLLAFRHVLMRDKKELTISGISPQLKSLMATYRITDLFNPKGVT